MIESLSQWGFEEYPFFGPIDFTQPEQQSLFIEPSDFSHLKEFVVRAHRLRNQCVHLIYGERGTGKTTCLAALKHHFSGSQIININQYVEDGNSLSRSAIARFIIDIIKFLADRAIYDDIVISNLKRISEDFGSSSSHEVQIDDFIYRFRSELVYSDEIVAETIDYLFIDGLDHVENRHVNFFLQLLGNVTWHTHRLVIVATAHSKIQPLLITSRFRGFEADYFSLHKFVPTRSNEIIEDRIRRVRSESRLDRPFLDASTIKYFNTSNNHSHNMRLMKNIFDYYDEMVVNNTLPLSQDILTKADAIIGRGNNNTNNNVIYVDFSSASEESISDDLNITQEIYRSIEDRIQHVESFTDNELAVEIAELIGAGSELSQKLELAFKKSTVLAEHRRQFKSHVDSTYSLGIIHNVYPG